MITFCRPYLHVPFTTANFLIRFHLYLSTQTKHATERPTTSSLDKLPKCLVSAEYTIIFTRRNWTLIFYHVNCILQVDSEEEKIPEEKFVEELAKNLPQGTDKTPELLDSALKDLPDRYAHTNKSCYFYECVLNYYSKLYFKKYIQIHTGIHINICMYIPAVCIWQKTTFTQIRYKNNLRFMVA